MKNLFKKIKFCTLSVKTQARKPFLQKLKTATSGKLISSKPRKNYQHLFLMNLMLNINIKQKTFQIP